MTLGFEQQLLELMDRLIDAIDRQTEASMQATDAQRDAIDRQTETFRVATDRQFKFYADLHTAAQKTEGEAHSEPMD